MIVATAGHIDHGKSLLVRILTGVDTDRLPEEKRRGLSIDLGFAYADLGDGAVTGFVDVPGHERFVRNMLAGVGGIDCALLIVAADDGPMPQTEEHLAILDLLGVSRGCVALTKIDRVAPERVQEVTGLTETLLEGTSLAAAPVFPVSGLTGDGVDALRSHLAEIAAALPTRSRGGGFRLAIDRCFTLPGAGLVVTGTVFAGRAESGDHLVLVPTGREVRVRRIHAQNAEAPEGAAGQRCAVNITAAGLTRDDITRGDWLAAAHSQTRRLDARIRIPTAAKGPFAHWTPVHLHLGATDIPGRVALLEQRSLDPGADGLAQIITDRPLGALYGDRFILRDQSGRRTLAGGRVIDPFSPARGRARPERLAMLARMEEEDPEVALAALLEAASEGLDLSPFAQARNLTGNEATALWQAVPMVRVGRPEAPAGITLTHRDRLAESTLARIGNWHRERPGEPGPDENQLRRLLSPRPHPAVFSAILLAMLEDGRLAREGAALRLPTHRAALAGDENILWTVMKPLLEAEDLLPPRVRELAEALEKPPQEIERFLFRAARLGLVFPVARNRFFLPQTIHRLAEIAAGLADGANEGAFSAAAFRDASGIGRNVTIQVLEYFDKVGLTRRVGDARELRKPVIEVFGGG